MLLNVNIPMTGKPSDFVYDQGDVLKRMAILTGRYGTAFEQAHQLNNVPSQLLAGIVLIENFDLDPSAIHRNSTRIQDAVGFGQHKMYSATDVLIKARQKKLLTAEKRVVFARRLGAARLAKIDALGLGGAFVVTQEDLKDPEFNLMLTGLHLSTLISESVSITNVVRVDKVGYRYNQGYYAKFPKPSSTTEELLAGVSGEGRRYVLRLVGRGGILEVLSK